MWWTKRITMRSPYDLIPIQTPFKVCKVLTIPTIVEPFSAEDLWQIHGCREIHLLQGLRQVDLHGRLALFSAKNGTSESSTYPLAICFMYGISSYIWKILVANVGKCCSTMEVWPCQWGNEAVNMWGLAKYDQKHVISPAWHTILT